MTENNVEEKFLRKKSTKKIHEGCSLVIITDFPLRVKGNDSKNQISIGIRDEKQSYVENKDYKLDIEEVEESKIVVSARVISPRMLIELETLRPTVVVEIPDYEFALIDIKSTCGDLSFYCDACADRIRVLGTQGSISGVFDCEDLDIKSLDGDVHCNTPSKNRKKVGGLIDIRTQSGNINGTLYADTMTFFSLNSKVSVTIRNEGNAAVFGRTIGGDISIYAKNYKDNEIIKHTLRGKILNPKLKRNPDAQYEIIGTVDSIGGTIFIT